MKSTPTRLRVGGEWRDASGGASFPVEDPATGETLVEVADASPADAQAAVDASAAAQSDWAATAPRERSEILRRAYETITDRLEELAVLMALVTPANRGPRDTSALPL